MTRHSSKEKMFPRDAAGSFELHGGTGGITGMVSCGDFLEIYKIDKTFKVVSPETVDPGRTNPNAPWVVSPVSDVGSSHPIVARFFIQSAEMLRAGVFRKIDDIDPVIKHLHSCKEILLECDVLAILIMDRISTLIEQIEKSGVSRDNRGRGLNPFPVVENLERDCSAFLVNVNRAIKQICGIPHLFLELDRSDSNFDHLGKRLSRLLGESAPFTTYVSENSKGIRYLVELRNFDEHPGEKHTQIKNFNVLPNGDIQVPTISLRGGEDPTEYTLKEALEKTVSYLVNVAEAVVTHAVLDGLSNDFPFLVERIPDSEVDESKPIRHRLTIDTTKLKLPEN